MAHVMGEIVDPWQASLVAKRVHCLRRTSGRKPGSPRSGGGVEPSSTRLFCGHVHVQLQFLFEVGIAPAREQRATEAMKPLAKHAHAAS
jgi:hypothetical protein